MDSSGFLLIDKPKHWTSHDVVAGLRKITGIKKIGHGGTLDPMATGLLVIGIGSATKQLEQFVQGEKSYLATVTLGTTSTTDDAEGELTTRAISDPPERSAIEQSLKKFVGTQEQLPPVFSAIKTDGKKAYAEARAGRQVERKPRLVTINSIDLVGYDFPELKIRTSVSKGTYIRALARDIGEVLGTGGYLTALRRESVGQYSVNDAKKLSELEHGWESSLIN